MASTIVHGANGGYKSSSVVQDRILPAVISGRVVVTNIRGVCLQRFYDADIDVHPDSLIIYIDTDNNKEGKLGRLLLACFWQWVPLNCLICFDESGVIFPKSWRDTDLKKLDIDKNGCLEHSIFEDFEIDDVERPADFVEAFEMHRHYGWDLVLSAPNIKSIRDDIRNTSELAWRHRNAALLGIKGRYKAVSHDPITLGNSASHVLSSKLAKINPRTFTLYDSTKTGEAKDTANAGSSILGSPRLLLALCCTIGAFTYTITSGGYDKLLTKAPDETPKISVSIPIKEDRHNISNALSVPQINTSSSLNLMGYSFSSVRIIGRFGAFPLFRGIDDSKLSYDFDRSVLIDSGYKLVRRSDCHYLIVSNNSVSSVYCALSPVEDSVYDDEDDDSTFKRSS